MHQYGGSLIPILRAKGITLDFKHKQLCRNAQTFIELKFFKDHFLIEDNSSNSSINPDEFHIPATPATSVIAPAAHVAEGVEDITKTQQHQNALADLNSHWQ